MPDAVTFLAAYALLSTVYGVWVTGFAVRQFERAERMLADLRAAETRDAMGVK